MLGADAFGDKIYEYLADNGIDVSLVKMTKQANTSLAFVSRYGTGNRSFSFYRKPGAGDAFIGSFLHSLYFDGVTAEQLENLDSKRLLKYLDFSNKYCAVSVKREGAIASYSTAEEMKLLINYKK